MSTCSQCGLTTHTRPANFCSSCGAAYSNEEKLPYMGASPTRGIYRITFPAQEEEFDHKDEVWDAIRHSTWNEDYPFEGTPTVEFIRSTVTPETHPFECGSCNIIVAETNTGRCTNCGEVRWERRST